MTRPVHVLSLAATAALLSVVVLTHGRTVRAEQARPARRAAAAAESADAVLASYCVTCHNARLRTAGLTIEPGGLANVGADAATWEQVATRLRTGAMPPAGAPRPDRATAARAAAAIEGALDRAAAAHPAIGATPLVRRLTRTEYQNAVRDLLALDALPREVAVDFLLPADNVSSGFDNLADLLFVSPSTMERYLDAARKISRLAMGDPAMPPLVNIHRLDAEQPQDERVDGLPFGTRGGLAVRSEFPADGTYAIRVELAGPAREPHDVEVTLDGARVAAATVGASGRGGRAADLTHEFRLPLTAGPRLVGVAFVQHSEARDEATLRPRLRSRGTQPAIATVTISGPYDITAPGDAPSRRRIFVCRPATAAEELPCARRILGSLARRAYRRPLADADLQDLLPFYERGRADGSFDLGIQAALERLLVSPQFLFRIERQPAGARPGDRVRVSDLELASRLSFFLWSSIPDDQLLDAAAAGHLSQPGVLEQQVRRMLADPRAEALVTNFAAQWLFLRDIDAKRPDEILFPDFDETLRAALRTETELFIGSVFREQRPIVELLTADYTFLNERLARHYGIAHVKGSHFRRVAVPPGSVRGGLLGQGSILTLTSYSTRTSPVLRGKWVLENLLSSAPPPPPADIPALRTEGAEPGRPLTMREAMAAHRASPSCASCHARMDPIGFAMENLDATGRWRDADAGQPIDASGRFPEGTTFDGVAGLRQVLLAQQDQFVSTAASRLLMYAIGRNLQAGDRPTVRAILRASAPARHTLPALVLGVVNSQPFTMREATP